MFPHKILIAALVTVAAAFAQQQAPKVKVNVLNVCAPSADEQKELSSALAKVPGQPKFSTDFEVARGRSTMDPHTPVPGMESLPTEGVPAADWVRIRREFPESALFSNVQYSFSVDSNNMVETLAIRVRDPKDKDMVQISIEDSASNVASPRAMLTSTTPISRVRLERFGKSSVALSRCSGGEGTPATDQRAYEPIFHTATSIMERYRDALNARKLVPEELARLGVKTPTKTGSASNR